MHKSDIYKKSIINFIFSFIIITIILLCLFFYINIKENLIIATLLNLFINIVIVIFIYKVDYSIIKLFIAPYMIVSSISIYSVLILFWNHSPLSLIWYLVFPIAAHHYFTMRSAVYWSIYITFLILITFFANHWFEVPHLEISKNNLFIINIFTLLSVIYLISFFLYYKHQITLTDLKENYIGGASDINESNDHNASIGASDTSNLYSTYNKIYNEIVYLFENDNIYLDSNFTISKLAEALDTNVSYVSRTLNSIAGSNFNTFLNKYRIEYIKKLMQDEDYDRYKLTYLYTQAGYKNQSTFNKVFKDFEGVTPTEYIQNLKENIQTENKKPQK